MHQTSRIGIKGGYKGRIDSSTEKLRINSSASICVCSELQEQACPATILRPTIWDERDRGKFSESVAAFVLKGCEASGNYTTGVAGSV
jgi:hypothetical protein